MVKALKRKNILTTEEVTKRPRILPEVRISDAEPIKNTKWTNRERVLYINCRKFPSKGKTLMKNLIRITPHSKTGDALDVKRNLSEVVKTAIEKNCTQIVHFESRKYIDLYMWMASVNEGPSIKFFVKHYEFSDYFKFPGNCLKGSRPLLSFSSDFSQRLEFQLMREMFIKIFGVPNCHPKSQPFIDRIYSFSVVNGSIAFRHYQIVDHKTQELVEIGPRLLLEPVKIFDGCMGGQPLFLNEHFVTPNQIKIQQKLEAKLMDQRGEKKEKVHKKAQLIELDQETVDDVFA